MGNVQSIDKINYERIQVELNNSRSILINTLPNHDQDCLIAKTVPVLQEEDILNHYLKNNTTVKVIIYGMNACDETLLKKYNQLCKLGFSSICVYPGGLFEWLLLQEIYGEELFPTTTMCRDHLRYKGKSPEDLLLLR
jgi:hypothetical protein